MLVIKVCQNFALILPLPSLILLHNLAVFVRLHLLDFYSSLVILITTGRHLHISLTPASDIVCAITH
jgi:hypothetical protein